MLAVAFEGCACRAAFHAGVAAALAERALPLSLTAGASSGSLIAVGLAAGRGAELPAIWRALAGRSIVSWRRVVHNRSPFDMSHLVRTTLERTLGGATADLRAPTSCRRSSPPASSRSSTAARCACAASCSSTAGSSTTCRSSRSSSAVRARSWP